jgi:hypothetical protein
MSDFERWAKNNMSLQQAIEIREKEAEIQRTSLPKLAAIGFSIFAVVFGLTLMSIGAGYSKTEDSKFTLLIIAFGLFFAYHHRKNKRRIDILELEMLKLKRRFSESKE